MAAPFRPVPSEQVLAFGRRVCAYIGVDPTIVLGDSFNWEVGRIDELGTVQFTVVIPAEDLLAMFNGEDRMPAPPRDDRPALTPRQNRMLAVIGSWVDDRGYPPSMSELGKAVGLTSSSSVAHQLTVLEAKGYIRRDPNKPRAITVIPCRG